MTSSGQPRRVILAVPHGFCAGVERAVDMAERVLREHPRPVYCLKQIVHNAHVIADLAARSMVFVSRVEDIPEGATALFSAHGVAPGVRQGALDRRIHLIDATCPFVLKVHSEVRRFAQKGFTIILIGNRNHDEIIGVAGEAPDRVAVVENEDDARAVAVPDPSRVTLLSQTTWSPEETRPILRVLRERFPLLQAPLQGDICYATRNRQTAVRELARRADVILVLGARNSSNSNRLVSVAAAAGRAAFLISNLPELDAVPLGQAAVVGLTAGASTPESLVREAIGRLKQLGFHDFEEMVVVRENLHLTGEKTPGDA